MPQIYYLLSLINVTICSGIYFSFLSF